MTTSDLRRLLKFNDWANARVLDALATLTPEQLTKDLGSSFASPVLTAAHMVAAEWIWLQRWLGASNSKFPDWAHSTDLADLRRRLTAIEAERWAFLDGLSDTDLAAPRAFKLMNGTEDLQPLDVMITPIPCFTKPSISRYSSAFAPTSTPRVGSSSSSTRGCVCSHRPMMHFC